MYQGAERMGQRAAGTLKGEMRRFIGLLITAAAFVFAARPVRAHPAPFSYLDLRLDRGGVSGALVIHEFDAAQYLKIESPDLLLDAQTAARHRDTLLAALIPRLSLLLDGRAAEITWGALEPVSERLSVRLAFRIAGERPGRIQVQALLFPYDPAHQTFVNIYEEGVLVHQAILDEERDTADYYSGTTQGRLAVIRTFVLSGIQHILIGPDHVLFLIGLLLLRGSMTRLALIVTAFTLGHSITLSLAALDIVSPPSRLIEPLIALTIVVVGADNLLVLGSASEPGRAAKDIRAWLAATFGLIHGFGFASVLKELGLPKSALGWSLFAFNVGVEIGQLAIVVVVAFSLLVLAGRGPLWSGRVARGGSIAVILAGTFWFIQRTFFPGG